MTDKTRYIIPLENYKRQHSPLSPRSEKTDLFIGREKEVDALHEILNSTKESRGSYLVAGYRGVGKTSFVNEVLSRYRIENKHLLSININLGNETKLDAKTVMSDMVSQLLTKFEYKSKKMPFFERIYKLNIFKKNRHLLRWFYHLLEVFIGVLIVLPFVLINDLYPNWIFEFANNIIDNFCTGDICSHKYRPYPIALFIIILGFSPYILKSLIRRLTHLNSYSVIRMLRTLDTDARYSDEYNVNANIKLFGGLFGGLKKRATLPLDANAIENKLRIILNKCRFEGFDIIFIFDELDKLTGFDLDPQNVETFDQNNKSRYSNTSRTDTPRKRREQVDYLLGNIKGLVTDSRARYIFIAGREIYDSYLSEKGDASSLYESLFNSYIYIPSLLSDKSDGNATILDGMIESFIVNKIMYREKNKKNIFNFIANKFRKNDKKNSKIIYYKLCDLAAACKNNNENIDVDEIFILKIFIHFLTFHSWGNFKRLHNLMETFIVHKNSLRGENFNNIEILRSKNSDCDNYLVIGHIDFQRFLFSSHLYILFHHSLSRNLTQADDKLIISAFAIFHYILKFHNVGFSRSHINRMYETLNIHSSPEVTRIIDMLIDNVLRNHLRRVRNSFYRYRFNSLFESEMHYITKVSDKESASFNFSLDASYYTKQYYTQLLQSHLDKNEYSFSTQVQLCNILGYFYLWEQSYDEANIYFGSAAQLLEQQLKKSSGLQLLLQYTEAMLRLAIVSERMSNYSLAASYYKDANNMIECHFECIECLNAEDSKWDTLKQAYWGMLFLNLKRSISRYKTPENRPKCFFEDSNHATYHYRIANFAYYIDNYEEAFENYIKTINVLNTDNNTSERCSYLSGNSFLKLGLVLLSWFLSKVAKNGEINDNQLMKLVSDNLGALSGINSVYEFGTYAELLYGDYKDNPFLIFCDNGFIEIGSYEIKHRDILKHSIGLCIKAAEYFEKSGLYTNAAYAYMNVLIIIQVFIDMMPLRVFAMMPLSVFANNLGNINMFNRRERKRVRKYYVKTYAPRQNIRQNISKLKTYDWFNQVATCAIGNCGRSTEQAYPQSLKTLLARDYGDTLSENSFYQQALSKAVLDENGDSQYTSHFAYQHYSILAKTVIAVINWSNTSITQIEGAHTNIYLENNNVRKILPYSIRYFAIMKWLEGKKSLGRLTKYIAILSRDLGPYIAGERNRDDEFNCVLGIAIPAITAFYHSSQYMATTSNGGFNMSMPPFFFISYNQWEVITILTELHSSLYFPEAHDYKKSYLEVRSGLDELLRRDHPGVSSRVLDLMYLTHYVREQLNIVIRLDDINARERTTIFRKKYYLDDDYEDMMFNTEWAYCRLLRPSAIIHRDYVEKKIRQLGLLNRANMQKSLNNPVIA